MKSYIVSLAIISTPFFFETVRAQEDCSIVECAQKAVEASYQAQKMFNQVLPKGAVMAFNLTSCPTGWIEYRPLEGRVIVGAGHGFDSDTNSGLTNRILRESGGTETHTLTQDEMPAHYHTGSFGGGNSSYEHHQNNHRLKGERPSNKTNSTGGGGAHNNMQPFHVLKYCERQ